ncbi:NADH:ubiquinone reductase (Na(+)-transporting) subunit C [bacterium SCSIO 12741]|nr:NADH:ubiquinone reductase (Na(+)-transporting) subunit C [bacterium SCSIO 12741]
MDKNSNGYTFGFAIVMVIVVGSLLSLAAVSLKPFQQENIQKEKKQNILASINVVTSRSEADALFSEYVKKQVVINNQGEVVSEEDGSAFGIDVKKEYKEWKAGAREESKLNFPLFVCNKDGEDYYVVPMVGTGLWGPIWGFVSLKGDLNTIFGANFDHKTETPGLGAEIKESIFEEQFSGDQIYANGEVAFVIMKGGGGSDNPNGVDGITGGTITSKGVEEMLQRTFEVYKPYFEKIKS